MVFVLLSSLLMMNKKPIFLIGLLFLISCNQSDRDPNIKESNSPSGLTEKNACLLSQLSYCTDIPAAVGKYLPGWIVQWEALELEGNYAFVASNGKEFALVIRGSLIGFSWGAFQNWIYQDLQVVSQIKWEYVNVPSNAKISQGAFDAWINLCKMTDKKTGRLLLNFLKAELKNDSRLLITGHSLGGNLATVYGSYLWQEFKKIRRDVTNINVITFGAPAAGNEAFASDFDQKFPTSIRVENTNDIVPKFPSASGISALSGLFNDSLSANKIQVGYKDLTVSLSTVLALFKTSISVLELTGTISPYIQTDGEGKKISFPLSGKNKGTDILNWLTEAGYQHGITSYAMMENMPLVECSQ